MGYEDLSLSIKYAGDSALPALDFAKLHFDPRGAY